MRLIALGLLATLGTLAHVANAATITSGVLNVANDQWRYNYTVTNDSLGADLAEFAIFFDPTVFTNLSVESSPIGWDLIVVQPDPQLPDDGFLDALALAGGITPGGSQGGFSLTFSWLGQSLPGAQPFDVIDPRSFTIIESGLTAVPLPGALGLMTLGVLTAMAATRRVLANT